MQPFYLNRALHAPKSVQARSALSFLTDQISNSYVYEALDSDSHEIRVFTLFPGTGSEQVAGKLIKTSLNDAFSYDALSYQCGTELLLQPSTSEGM